MENSSTFVDNTTNSLTVSSIRSQFIRWTFILSTSVCFSFFLCFITLLLNVFFKTPALQENARYVLFVFLLLNDTLYLLVGYCLWLAYIYLLHISVPLCFILYTVSSATFRVTPCNLAAMALEQYIAICHPLQHTQLCTTQRAKVVFTIICFLVMIPYAAEFYIMASSNTNIFSLYVICRQENLVFNPIQNVIRSIILILCFTSVAIVIISTYVKIMQVAKRVSPLSSFASKAMKTVLIHAFQLLLCSISLLSMINPGLPSAWPELWPVMRFFIFTCVPRFISPLIYGIRDELLRRYIRKTLYSYFC